MKRGITLISSMILMSICLAAWFAFARHHVFSNVRLHLSDAPQSAAASALNLTRVALSAYQPVKQKSGVPVEEYVPRLAPSISPLEWRNSVTDAIRAKGNLLTFKVVKSFLLRDDISTCKSDREKVLVINVKVQIIELVGLMESEERDDFLRTLYDYDSASAALAPWFSTAIPAPFYSKEAVILMVQGSVLQALVLSRVPDNIKLVYDLFDKHRSISRSSRTLLDNKIIDAVALDKLIMESGREKYTEALFGGDVQAEMDLLTPYILPLINNK